MTINGINCKVIEKYGKKAKIEIEGQILEISSEYLPQTAKSGQTVKLYFTSSQEGLETEKKVAQSILEEILNGN